MGYEIDAIPTEAPTLPFERVALTDAGRVQAFYHTKIGEAPTVEQATERLREEMEELEDAIDLMGLGRCDDEDCPCVPHDNAHLLKEMCDVLFTLHGLALAKGFNLTAAFQKVCDSNMTKAPGLVNGKVQKGPGYVEPDLSDYI